MTILVLHSHQSWVSKVLSEIEQTITQSIQFVHDFTPFVSTLSYQAKYDLVVCGVSKENTTIFQQLDDSQLKNVPILFVSNTNDPSLFFQSTRYRNSAFIVWPFQPLNLLVSLYQLCPEFILPNQSPLMLKGPKSEPIQIPKSTIRFIHSEGNYCFIYTDEHRFALKSSLKKLLEKLDGSFFQVHKRYCVNTHYITRIDWNSQQIYLLGNQNIPFGRNYRKDMLLWAGQAKRRVSPPDLYTKKIAEA